MQRRFAPVRPRFSWLAFTLALVIVGVACTSGSETADDPAPGPGEATVSGLPDDELTLPDGSSTTVADFVDGRPLVVNFFASWCPPCRAEMPDFQAVHADLADEVDFVGLAMQDTESAAAALVEETGVRYPWALDPDGAAYVGFGGFSMPTTVFVDPAGEIVGTVNGAVDEGQLRDLISENFGIDS